MRATLLVFFAIVLLDAQSELRWDDSKLRPFVIDHRNARGALVDLSDTLDKPAGRHGFVQIRNGHLARGDGKRLRLWGVHFTDWSRGSVMLPPREDAAVWASTLARHGVNCVRLHFIDLLAPRGIIDFSKPDTRSFDAGQLDRLDYLVVQLKERGIYVDLNLNVGRSYKEGDGVKDADKIRWGKGLVLYDPRLIELQKEYARQILTHKNPYTNLEYRNDPAVAIVEILNENALYQGFRAPTPYYDKVLTDIYNEWLAKRMNETQLAAYRSLARAAEGVPVARLKGNESAAAPRERYTTELAFYSEMEDRFYQDMAQFLRRDLGVRVPITGTADHSHSGSSYPMLATLSRLDIMDGHSYWQHPGSPDMNTPMVNSPLNSTVVRLSRSAVAGKPYTVSETNHPFPNDYLAEGIPILASYGALQDWDAIILYTFEPKLAADWKGYIGDPFDISHDPVRMTQMASGSLIFLRGDVAPARETLARTYSKDQIVDSRRLARTETPYFTPGFPHETPLIHQSRIGSFDGPVTKLPTIARQPGLIQSDTGELAWHSAANKGGAVKVDSPRTQALIGFLTENAIATKNMSTRLDTKFSALVLSSLDGKPISQSRRLLSAASRVTNTGLQWAPGDRRLAQIGGPPSLIEVVQGELILSSLAGAKGLQIQALDGSGRALGTPVDASHSGNSWRIPLGSEGSAPTTWYKVDVRH